MVLAHLVHALSLLRRLLREPLVHFLAAGAAIYLLHAWVAPRDPGSHHIVVDRAALLEYLQYQARAFEPGTFGARFDAMTPAERRRLVDDYVREEVLYREAQALGLAQGDYVMRRRLVQKMEFLLEPAAGIEPTDGQLQQYLAAHRDQYRVAAAWTFTHVFLDAAGRDEATGDRQARRLLERLNRDQVPFHEAARHGERFAFLQNYVERTADYVDSQFGDGFAAALDRLPVDGHRWQGPLRSEQGWHLVLLTAKAAARDPQLAELHAQVRDDWRRDEMARRQQQAARDLVAGYRVALQGLGEVAP